MPPNLRQATPKDADAITALTRAAYTPWIAVIGRDPMPMTIDYHAALQIHRFDLLERDGALIGLVETYAAADHLHVENLAVHPAHHGKGLGDALLRHAERLASDAGFHIAGLETNAAYARNLAFYAKRGYIESAREPSARGGVLVHFRKNLGA
jgi:ribosomal protein S18 acetylase RimI-like enzyme